MIIENPFYWIPTIHFFMFLGFYLVIYSNIVHELICFAEEFVIVKSL